MGEILVTYIALSIACLYFGVKLIRFGSKTPAPQPIPPATLANLEGRDRSYAKTARAAAAAKGIWRPISVLSGLALIFAPFVTAFVVLNDLSKSFGGSKGRVLRIRNRAQLAEPALGDGWSNDPIELRGTLTAAERKALGELWLLTSRMEHASVAAFSQLSLHLSALGAPSHLLEATHRAALEEIRHTRACFAITRAITGEPHTAGPIPALGAARTSTIDLTRLAIGSLIDGCLAEGIAADVAARSSARATEPIIRDTLAMIAREEAGHAELAWDVLAWSLDAGGDAVHEAVRARVEILDREIAPRLPDLPGVDDATLARYGVIDQDALGTLATARVAAVQSRARQLLAEDVALAA